MCIKHYYISKKISRPRSAELGSKTVFLWKNWKKSIFVQFWGTIKNEVFPTSKPHKMTKNDCFIKKKIPPRYYAYINHQKNFQSGLTSGSAGLRKNMRDPPPPLPTRFGVRFFIFWKKNLLFFHNISDNKFFFLKKSNFLFFKIF